MSLLLRIRNPSCQQGTSVPLIAYASRTGTKRNLDALRERGWHILVSARGEHRTEGFPYAIDNGAWTAHTHNEPFDEAAFIRVVNYLGDNAEFVVAPDIVMGGLPSLAMSLSWLPWLRDRCKRVLIPTQDGMEDEDLAPFLSERHGIFVGGSTEWKEATTERWSKLAHKHGAWCHVGRVNTMRRIRICITACVDSFDGSSASRYAKSLPKLDNQRRQICLWSHDASDSRHG